MVGESLCSCEMVEAGTLQGHQVPAVGGQAHQGLPVCYSLALLITSHKLVLLTELVLLTWSVRLTQLETHR